MLLTGEYSLYFIDPWLYESLVENKRVQKLTDVLSSMPVGAVDEYGVRLGDTEIYKYYQVLQILPEDTIICLLHPYIYGQSSNEEYYKKLDSECSSIRVMLISSIRTAKENI
jgi:hypothetical protein